MESSDKMWSTGEGNSEPLQHSCLENPMNSMKRIAWSYVIQCLAFRGTNKLFSAVAALFNIPANSLQGFQFLHIPPQHLLFSVVIALFFFLMVTILCVR